MTDSAGMTGSAGMTDSAGTTGRVDVTDVTDFATDFVLGVTRRRSESQDGGSGGDCGGCMTSQPFWVWQPSYGWNLPA
ncbi:MAG: hypothetical protein HZY76_13015 [Anaerolineae bacterium]|nr:MAG: hypothetical protein HZY76_13015 [Anaerolineae bacterium]